MPSQDLIFPLLPRIPAPQPLGQNDLAAVGALTKRPVIEEEWDKKKPVQEDAIFDPHPGEGGGEAAQQERRHDAEPIGEGLRGPGGGPAAQDDGVGHHEQAPGGPRGQRQPAPEQPAAEQEQSGRDADGHIDIFA